ncbi:acyloxyacyl hydrolase [Paraburkholderia sp. GAS334]|jgi:lipid A 3-O-deacylase|uniref:acyloxyacyl hydrolase n=1 Tax=unclassified Paraburkholderia TaxID=2615204 RepID=UPI003D1CA817
MKKKNSSLGPALRCAFVLGLLTFSGLAAADQFGVQVAGGMADHHVNKLDLGVVWDPDLTWWEIGGWHFSLIGEAHVAWWHSSEGDVHKNTGELGVTPVIRFIKGSGWFRPFIEAGVGVRVLTSPTISRSYTLSTAFQFADMAGVGAQFGDRQQYAAGFRFQHMSNAGIKEPNPGINFTQLYLQYNF